MLVYLLAVDGLNGKIKMSQIYLKYHNLLFISALKITGDPRDAEDAVHEVFLQMGRFLHKFESVNHPRTKVFLLAAVESRASDIYRRRKLHIEVPFEEEWMTPESDKSEEVAQRDALHYALKSLSEDGRRALLLKHDVGLSVPEIAKVLGKTTQTTYKLLERAQKQLAENLRKEGIEVED